MMRQERAPRESIWGSDADHGSIDVRDHATPPVATRPARQRLVDSDGRTTSRPHRSKYRSIARISGHLAGLVLSAALWLIGAFFTVIWLQRVSSFDLGTSISRLGVGAYLVPVLVTAIQAGLWPGYNTETEPTSLWRRAYQLVNAWLWPSNPEARVTNIIWLLTVAWSTYTTASGLVLSGLLNDLAIPRQWLFGLVIGAVLDMAPEKLGRSLVRSLAHECRIARFGARPRRSEG